SFWWERSDSAVNTAGERADSGGGVGLFRMGAVSNAPFEKGPLVFAASALKAAEAEFHRLVPAPLFLQDIDLEKAGALPRGGLDLLAVRDLLLAPGTGREVKDAVWRVVIARARWSGEWMVGAMGLAKPALAAVVRRCSRGLNAEQAAEIESEVAAGFIAAVREVNP